MGTLMEILQGVVIVVGVLGVAALCLFVMNPRVHALSDEEKERAYQRRVETEVAKRLDEERFKADVYRRLQAVREPHLDASRMRTATEQSSAREEV